MSGGQGQGGTMEVLTLAIACHEGHPPADDIFGLAVVRRDRAVGR
jgi:hypothetical protein